MEVNKPWYLGGGTQVSGEIISVKLYNKLNQDRQDVILAYPRKLVKDGLGPPCDVSDRLHRIASHSPPGPVIGWGRAAR